MLLRKKRGSWEFQPDERADHHSEEFLDSLAQRIPNGQKEDCFEDTGRCEDMMADSCRQHRKHVLFVLSEAGKPIYSRYGSKEALSFTMGVMMPLVSFIQAGGNTIQMTERFSFCRRGRWCWYPSAIRTTAL
ncbi:vacuolar fusion protein MON1 homolog B isoform X2 [Paramisgurnus dabryanus]|uniref:vacuolar fusion protein MON1 homolog B isoform X2 n=1 Tax=Paramisgurnus dabryanus TaxID=90735 RepID=UPI003CCFB981